MWEAASDAGMEAQVPRCLTGVLTASTAGSSRCCKIAEVTRQIDQAIATADYSNAAALRREAMSLQANTPAGALALRQTLATAIGDTKVPPSTSFVACCVILHLQEEGGPLELTAKEYKLIRIDPAKIDTAPLP